MLTSMRIALSLFVLFVVAVSAGAWTTPANITNLPDYECNPRGVRGTDSWKHVVWFGGPSGSWKIYYQKSLDSISWTSPVAISDAIAQYPDIDIGSLNNLHVVWYHGNNPEEIYYRNCTNGTWGTIVNVSNTAGTRSLCPRVAVSWRQAEMMVVWHESNQNNNTYDIFARRMSNGVWQSVENISNDATLSSYADVCSDGNGKFHVVWQDNDTKNVFYRSCQPGSPWGPKWVMDDNTAGRSYNPSISGCEEQSGDSKLFVAWHDDTPGNWEIYYKYYNGSSWSGITNVSANGRSDSYACVDGDINGNAYMVWSDYNYIFARHQVNGAWQSVQTISTVNQSKNPFLLRTTTGYSHAFWQASQGSWNVYYSYQ